jgi:phosphoserine phosphatase
VTRRIVFVDIDGTLVTGTSSGSFLAQRLGHVTEVDEAEAAYAAGTIDNHEVCAIDARGWAGTHETQVDAWLEDLPLVDGIDRTVAWCRSHDVVPVLASLAWDPVGAHLARRFGFSDHCGPQLRTTAGIYTGEVSQTFDEYDKRDFALSVCHQLEVDPAHCVAIGDSRSDLPLFDVVGFSIALNASPDARSRASTTLESGSLANVVPLIQPWLASAQFCHAQHNSR